ncbi:hypothetical protein QAD02_009294 [Eretmocerus hayati]|uniref:Uncharacterized protein n=1 Tax=Eretmocerus hayati TaxID=131215 RepID=A0ACC2NAA9_9HYME|nr:hypothetical protein QAD02_009294 [Eretmocerus hayati]
MNERFQEPALFIGEIDDDINLTMPPATGEEYIKRVIFEARQCEEVVFAKIDETRLRKPTLNVKPLPECKEAPECLRPTQEWQKCQIADFSNLRLYIAQLRSEITNRKCKRKLVHNKLPYANDHKSWLEICTGINESSYMEPTLTVVLSMNQPTIEQVLEYLVDFLLEQESIQPALGRWLYALLSALELPLNPDVCSCLRSLARTSSTLRSQLDPSKVNEAASLNLFICIVARYFRQLDLADP